MGSTSPFLLALFALLVVGGAIHVVFLVLAYRGRKLSGREAVTDGSENEPLDPFAAEDGDPEEGNPAVDTSSTATVRCPSCRTVNDADFSYCRECVADLRG